jgi:hypothetical protein
VTSALQQPSGGLWAELLIRSSLQKDCTAVPGSPRLPLVVCLSTGSGLAQVPPGQDLAASAEPLVGCLLVCCSWLHGVPVTCGLCRGSYWLPLSSAAEPCGVLHSTWAQPVPAESSKHASSNRYAGPCMAGATSSPGGPCKAAWAAAISDSLAAAGSSAWCVRRCVTHLDAGPFAFAQQQDVPDPSFTCVKSVCFGGGGAGTSRAAAAAGCAMCSGGGGAGASSVWGGYITLAAQRAPEGVQGWCSLQGSTVFLVGTAAL